MGPRRDRLYRDGRPGAVLTLSRLADDSSAGRDLAEDLGLEPTDPHSRPAPRVGGSPAFSQVPESSSSAVHPCSGATWGSRRPLVPRPSTMSPSRPTWTAATVAAGGPAGIGVGRPRIETSTVSRPSSWAVTGGNRGSSTAADTAASAIAWPSGSTGRGNPMQPRRSPEGYRLRVTKAPRRSANSGGVPSADGFARPGPEGRFEGGPGPADRRFPVRVGYHRLRRGPGRGKRRRAPARPRFIHEGGSPPSPCRFPRRSSACSTRRSA